MFLGIDVGTSAVKVVLMAEDGRVLHQDSAALAVEHPAPLRSEQHPEAWWIAVCVAIAALPAASRRRVRAIGLAGQMHGATLLGAADEPLRAAMLWNDGRAAVECAELEKLEPRCRAITANAAMAGFTAPKLLWLRKHEPDVFARATTVLLPKDYIRLRMTGDKATDMSDASGTLWLDVAARRWSDEMLSATGLSEIQMPKLFEGNQITGILRADVAAGWGMNCVPVAAGGGDNAAAAVGLGVIDDGDAFLSLGTSGVVFVATSTLRPDTRNGLHAFCHAIPDRWHQMSVMLSAASCLDWAATSLVHASDVATFVDLAAQARDPIPLFLPYLTGERTPHADPRAQGVLFGLTTQTDRPAVARAVLEGVAMGLRDGLDTILATGSPVDSLTVAGGGSRSQFWGRLLAAALGRPMVYRLGAEVGPAYGAARLAQLALDGGRIRDVCTAPAITAVIEPAGDLMDYFAKRQPRFRDIFRSLQPHFQDSAS